MIHATINQRRRLLLGYDYGGATCAATEKCGTPKTGAEENFIGL